MSEACPDLPEWAVTAAAQQVVGDARAELQELISRGAKESEIDAVIEVSWAVRVAAVATRLASPHPRRVVNATGVVLHTNLGRSPLAEGAARAVAEAASHYADLELDLETGQRGNRLSALARKLEILSGAEAAMAVNNNAAAVLLALNTLARGREVVVSRGELVEIGGSFRVPAIMERAGVKLVEVGTTNRTHARDYFEAVGPDTALLLKVHRSNFEQRGFVKEVQLGELVEIGRECGLPVIEDLGAGTLLDLSDRGFPADSDARSRLELGVDLVCFSGDKLFGGPQAGILLGRREFVDAMRKNPLARALRLDKLSLAALDWTVGELLAGRGEAEIPALARMLEGLESLDRRAQALFARLEPVAGDRAKLGIETDRVPVGGGSLPGFELETRVLTIRSAAAGPSSQRIVDGLLRGSVPVLARVRDESVCLDLRTIADEDHELIAAALEATLR